jgi:hypothetical protein
MQSENEADYQRSAFPSIVLGAALGLPVAVLALFAAIASAGAGHGDYVAARALFPASMLLTLQEDHIGTQSIVLALLQFPIYGGLLGWSLLRKSYLPAIAVGAFHLVAVVICFSGALPNFS